MGHKIDSYKCYTVTYHCPFWSENAEPSIVHSRTDIGVHVQTQIKPLGNCSNFLPEIQTNGHRYCAMI